MSMRYSMVSMALFLSLLVAACGQPPPTPEAMAESSTEEATMKPQDDGMATSAVDEMMKEATKPPLAPATPKAMTTDEGDSMALPDFFRLELTDAATGSTFRISDFKDKVVLLEPFAQWCSKCLSQQGRLAEAYAQLDDRDDFIAIGLDVDPNETYEALKGYVARNGFSWLYAISPPEMSREIGNLYGDLFLNPTSTPMLLIDRHGEVHPLPFGIKSAGELLKAIRPLLDESM